MQSSSQVLVHFKATPATAGFWGNRWQRRKQRLGHPVWRESAPVVHKNVSQAHIGVECWGRSVVKLCKAQAAQVQGAADGDSCRGVRGRWGQEGGWQWLSDGCSTHVDEVLRGGPFSTGSQRLAALLELPLLLEQQGIGADTRWDAAGGGEAVEPGLHFQLLKEHQNIFRPWNDWQTWFFQNHFLDFTCQKLFPDYFRK